MAIEGSREGGAARRLRLGMVGGGEGAFIGAVHRTASRLDDCFEFVAGALASEPARARASGAALRLAPERTYDDFATMAARERSRDDRIDAVAIVTPNHVHHAAACVFLDAGIAVICDKPLTTTLADAQDLASRVKRSGVVFAVTYNYTGYPMVRQAREMIASGALGALRKIQVEYVQDWLSTPLEATGQKQAAWRTDPARSGPAGCLGDIGTHAFQLAEFVSGQDCTHVAAQLSTFVPGRRVDDDVQTLLRFAGGARGGLWASQVSPGNENGLRLRIYGEKGGLVWQQEHPNQLTFAKLGETPITLSRGGPGAGAAAAHATRVPAGHPEGYTEAFAQLYRDVAEQIHAQLGRRAPDPRALLVPTVRDGLRGVAFVAATIASSKADGAWTAIST
jgi:predicted dehydrogenase